MEGEIGEGGGVFVVQSIIEVGCEDLVGDQHTHVVTKLTATTKTYRGHPSAPIQILSRGLLNV